MLGRQLSPRRRKRVDLPHVFGPLGLHTAHARSLLCQHPAFAQLPRSRERQGLRPRAGRAAWGHALCEQRAHGVCAQDLYDGIPSTCGLMAASFSKTSNGDVR